MNQLSENITRNLARHGGTFAVTAHRQQAIDQFASDSAYAAFNRAGHSGTPSAAYLRSHAEEVARMIAAGQLDLVEKHNPTGSYWLFS